MRTAGGGARQCPEMDTVHRRGSDSRSGLISEPHGRRQSGGPRGIPVARQLSAKSLDLVAKHGFEYSSNMVDRLVPYLHPEAHGVTNFAFQAFHTSMNSWSSNPLTEPS